MSHRAVRRVTTTIAALLLFLCVTSTPVLAAEADGAEARNKEVVLLAVELMNTGQYDQLDQVIAQNYRRHSQATPDANVDSLDAFVALLEQWDIPFTDVENKVHLLIAEGDLVAMWGTYAGTHTGPMGPFPATGKRMSSDFSGYHRMEDGKIAETWVTWDNMAIFNQLELSTCPPQVEGGD